ncbi:MAG: GNAT family N-acetyltransferase [Caulobacterales bacterium 32-69-10]|nr:MAG: GNAT family N-acetyltransferase [Caulobacterales bacterium 32-69-10]
MPSIDLGPTLETERLILRPPAPEDFEPWCAFSGDPEASRFLGGVQSGPVVWRSLRYMAGCWALDGFGMFSVIEKATGRWVGRLGPIFPEGWPGAEVGWGLTRESWGKGYATEGAAVCMDWVFDVLGWTDVIHTIAPDNLASAGVARRLGSTNRGPGKLPDPFADQPVDIWGQTREQWRARG